MPSKAHKRKTKTGNSPDVNALPMPQASKSVDFTQYLLPLEKWLEVYTDGLDWVATVRGHGQGFIYFANKLQLKEEEVNDHQNSHFLHDKVRRSYLDYRKVQLYTNPQLAFPIRGQPSLGYSWISWTFAARYAGAKVPVASLSDVWTIAQAGLEYSTSTLREWRTDPGAFASYANKLLEGSRRVSESAPGARNENTMEARTAETDMISYRVCHMFQLVYFWVQVCKSIICLMTLGMPNSGRKASAAMSHSKEMKDEFLFLFALVRDQREYEKGIMREAFAKFIDPRYLKIAEKEYQEKDGASWINKRGDRSVILDETRKQLHQRSFLEYNLAGMAGLLDDIEDIGETCMRNATLAQFKFGFYSLAYEQSLKKDPKLAKYVHPYYRQLIGESAMREELLEAIKSIVLVEHTCHCDPLIIIQDDDVPPSPDESLGGLQSIFSWCKPFTSNPLEKLIPRESPPKFILPDNGHFDISTAEQFWHHWDTIAQKATGKNLDEAFGLVELLGPNDPQWQPTTEVQIEDSEGIPETWHPLDQPYLAWSGHKYMRDEIKTQLTNKVKKRGAASCFKVSTAAMNPVGDVDFESKIDTHPVFYVTSKQMRLVQRLFSESGDEDSQGQIRWDDFYKLMTRVGFLVEEIGGSVVRFSPPNNAGIPFNEHRPHPEVAIDSIRYRALGKKLNERYGWTAGWFVRSSQAVHAQDD